MYMGISIHNIHTYIYIYIYIYIYNIWVCLYECLCVKIRKSILQKRTTIKKQKIDQNLKSHYISISLANALRTIVISILNIIAAIFKNTFD